MTLWKAVARDPTINIKVEEIKNFLCEACLFAKAKRKPFKTCEPKKYTPGEFIHSDVCGPFPTTANNGARFFLLLKDDATEYRVVYTMKNKSDVYTKFVEFANIIRNKFQHDIRVLKTDNGREYVNEDVLKFLKTRGIEHQTTAPHNPEQNGKAEREIRTLTEMLRAMIFGRKLKFLWCYAVVMAADILNKTMTHSDGKSPYEA